MHIDRRLLGWGAFFILLGAVPLAVSGGAVDRDIVERWPTLWPLLLVGAGLGLVLRRTPLEWVGGAIGAITFGVMGGGLIATGVSGFPFAGTCGTPGGSTQAFAPESGTMTADGRFSIRFDCGTLDVVTADGGGWSVTGTNGDGRSPRARSDASGVALEPEDVGTDGFRFDRGAASWTVTVPRTPVLDLGLTLNAGSGTADLAGANLRAASLTVNAGSLEVLLGGANGLTSTNATVNAGKLTLGLPAASGSARLTVNAGSLRLCVPEGTAVIVHWGGGLGSNDLDGLGLEKIGQDTWRSPGYDAASIKLDISANANAGSFALQIGGTCGA